MKHTPSTPDTGLPETTPSFQLFSKTPWYDRIWYLVSNPFVYLLTGRWRL